MRVVFDLSRPLPYRVRVRARGGDAGELALEFSGLSAIGLPKKLKLAGPGGMTLTLERDGGSNVLARIPLPRRAVHYRHFSLVDPSRVVLDLALQPPALREDVDFRTGLILLSPSRVAPHGGFIARARRTAPSPRQIRTARASTVVLSPSLNEEWVAPVVREPSAPREEKTLIPRAPQGPQAPVQAMTGWRPFFERPPIPELKKGEKGAVEFLRAVRHYTEGRSAQAAEAFGSFVRAFPKSRLAPAAAYLVGDSYFEGEPAVKKEAKPPAKGEKSGPEKRKPPSREQKRAAKQRWLRRAAQAYREAVQNHPRTDWTPWGLLQLGRSESRLGLYFRAETTFQEFLDRYPDHPLAAVASAHQGFANLKLGDAELALEIFGRALKHPKASPHARALARYGLGGVYLRLKKVESAKAEFEKARRAAPTLGKYFPDTLFLMGETFLASREYARARNAYSMQLELFPDSADRPFVLTRIAESHFLEKDLDKAVARYSEVIQQYPETESAIISLIRLADLAIEEPDYVRKKRDVKILALLDPFGMYRKIAKRGAPRPLAELAWLRLGEALLRRKQYGEAVEVFRTMADDYSRGRFYGRALFGLEEAVVGRIDQKHREQQYLEVLHLYHSEQDRGLKGLIRAAPLIQVAGSYQQLGLFEKAEETLRRVDVSGATAREREDIEILKIEGLMALGRWKELEPELKGYLRRYPEGRVRVKVARSLAEVLVQSERWREAEGFLKKAVLEVGRGMERARMEHLLARVFTHGERYAMAVDSLRRVIRVMPKGEPAPSFLADAYYLLGENLISLGQFNEAASVLEEGAARFPKDALRGWALFEAGQALWRLGEAERAGKALDALSSGSVYGFWRRMAQAMKEDINWWQKHKALQN